MLGYGYDRERFPRSSGENGEKRALTAGRRPEYAAMTAASIDSRCPSPERCSTSRAAVSEGTWVGGPYFLEGRIEPVRRDDRFLADARSAEMECIEVIQAIVLPL